ncbi:MAG: HAMP domain-containing protein, partial [Chloroflexota bacterium]
MDTQNIKLLMTHYLRSIQMKIALWTGLCLLLAAAVLIAYAAVAIRNTAIDAAEEQGVAVAKSEAAAIKAEIEVALDAARTLAQALAAIKHDDLDLNRAQVNAMLQHVLDGNPQFVGTGNGWEPNAFDGMDAAYVGQEGHDQTGRFIPYWSRDAAGQIRVEPLVDYDIADWYVLPKETKQEAIIEPYLYPVQGKEVLMTTLVAPIVADGQFYGIVGVDLKLDFLQELADKVDVYGGTGELILVSHGGALAGVTGRPELVGQHFQAYGDKNWEEDLTRVQAGQEFFEFDEGYLSTFVPIKVGRTTTPWSVGLNIPYEQVTAEATSLMWRLIGFGALLAGVALALLWVAAGQIAKPVKEITAAARAVADGDLTVEAAVQSNDEIGLLASAFNQMTARLRQMIEVEQQAKEALQHTVVEYVAFADKVGAGDLNDQLVLNGTEADPLFRLGSNINSMVDNLRRRMAAEQEARTYLEQTVDNYLSFVERVAAGDLSARLSLNGNNDALTILGRNLNNMVERLGEMTGQIREAAGNLSSAAAEILAATRQQAAGANEQSAAIAQTSTTIDEVKTIVEQAFAKAQTVAEQAQRTRQVSEGGQQAVINTVEGMNQIKEKVEGIAENILALSEQTQQIGEIIAT